MRDHMTLTPALSHPRNSRTISVYLCLSVAQIPARFDPLSVLCDSVVNLLKKGLK